MSFVGTFLLAQKRNRVRSAELVSKLNLLEKEAKGELRIHNTIKQRFQARYSKLEALAGIDESCRVKMYVTHNPGFCFRRNGDCRIPQQQPVASFIDYDDLHEMLFTNGELDTNKIICLHLLTAHKSDSLAPSIRPSGYIAKDMCPVERLIERSKRKRIENPMLNLLPLYIIELGEEDEVSVRDEPKSCISDVRLSSRILINEKIQIIIGTVLAALDTSCRKKLDNLVKIANDNEALADMLEKPINQLFIRNLLNKKIVTCCESFYLSPPMIYKFNELFLPNNARIVDSFLNYIRLNILQFPSKVKALHNMDEDVENVFIPERKCSADAYVSFTNIRLDSVTSIGGNIFSVKEFDPLKTNLVETNEEATDRISLVSNRDNRKTLKDGKKVQSLEQIYESKIQEETVSINNFIAPNQSEFVGEKLLKKIFVRDPKTPLQHRIDYGGLAIILHRKTNQAIKRDLDSLKMKATDKEEKVHVDDCHSPLPTINKSCKGHAKVSIRRSNCPACLQNWRKPIPIPKSWKKLVLPNLDQTNYKSYKTESLHMISTIIDRELIKLESDRKTERIKLNVVKSIDSDRKSFNFLPENIDLDAIDLAKINQEIREKETGSKLEIFLKTEKLNKQHHQ